MTRAQKAAALQQVQRDRAIEAAWEAALVLSLAEDTPATLDPPPGTPGARSGSWAPRGELPGVREFFPAELAVVLNCGRGTAAHLARRAWVWREHLPQTFAALGPSGITRSTRPPGLRHPDAPAEDPPPPPPPDPPPF